MKERALRLLKIYAVIVILGISYAAFFAKTGIGIPCMIRKLTGFRCPGCGISHMAIELLKGHVAKAYGCNRAVFLLLPVILILWGRYLYCYIKIGEAGLKKLDRILVFGSIVCLVIWGIVRNLPGLEYLN